MHRAKNQYIVHKFGGSSLSDANRFIALKEILTGKDEIIVVSAIKDTTNQLQAMLDMARVSIDFMPMLENLAETHYTLITHLLSEINCAKLKTEIGKNMDEIKNILYSVQLLSSYTAEIQDLILGYGEQWSAKILNAYLANDSQTAYLDATRVLTIGHQNDMIVIDWDKSQQALDHFLQNNHFDQLIVTGFIAATAEGRRTTLGRNGSDYSAAIFANLFKAKSLTIWTDVDGIFSADPMRVRSAFAIDSMSYKEALEMAYFGAKVLHPKTIVPVLSQQIPIYIKNSFKPQAEGTCITADPLQSIHAIRGLSSIDNIALINIEGSGMIGVSGIAARVFQILHQAQISVILISQASSEHSICFAVTSDAADRAVSVLTENLQFDMERQYIEKIYADKSCAILAAVGENMVGACGIAGKLCDTLAKANINIRAIVQGSSERNISLVVKNKDVNKALRAVHSGFYLSNKTISVGLIGPGLVGSTLLQQITQAQKLLQEQYQVNLSVRGIMNSKNMLLADDAIDLENWADRFAQCVCAADLETFANHIRADDVPHAVIIDCTANKHIAERYVDLIAQGIHVITPNKHANAGDLIYYKKLKMLAQQKKSHYLYETTVCAGLPVITTLQDIIKTGDEVLAIKGVVSGTLSYIFNELSEGKPFSEIVLAAKQKGFTEPDPREDLSGMDVARKLVCLAREIGFAASLDDVAVYNLVPEDLKNVSVDEFLLRLPDYDNELAHFAQNAMSQKQKLCYVGAINQQGKLSVALDSFDQNHPFARLKGTDNMLIFNTRRYHEQPLIIQGPGAGAEVTAAGVFADLLRLVSYLA